MSGPLAGLTVVEMAGIGPTPLAGQLLADLGATVTVIARRAATAPNPTDINSRGKRSIALDLKKPAATAVALDLIGSADVLIEGLRPGVMERLGLGPEECLGRNPRLVYGRMTGWGQEGPMAGMAGHDINYVGLTGLLHAIGKPDEPPPPPLNAVADYGGGTMFLLFGVMAALWERQTSGKGQVVDAAMVDGVSAMMALIHGLRAQGSWSDRRGSNLLDGGAPFYRSYECADGRFLAVGPIEPQFFAVLCERTNAPEKLASLQYDASRWSEQHETLEELFRQKPRDEWVTIFDGSDACVTPVLDWSEAPGHPHLASRKTFIEIGGVGQAAPAPRFSRTETSTPTAPQASGADADRILSEAGYDETAISELRSQGVVK